MKTPESTSSTDVVTGNQIETALGGRDDADRIREAILSGLNDARFDLTMDGIVDSADLRAWIKDVANSWLGDANVDGVFDRFDIIQVLRAGRYETGNPALWSEGEWNGDGRFDQADIIESLQDGGYGRGVRA